MITFLNLVRGNLDPKTASEIDDLMTQVRSFTENLMIDYFSSQREKVTNDDAWTDEEEVQPGEPELPDGASPEVAPDRPVPRRISQNSKTKLNIYEVQVQKNSRFAEF